MVRRKKIKKTDAVDLTRGGGGGYPIFCILFEIQFSSILGDVVLKKFTIRNFSRLAVRRVLLGSVLACGAVNAAHADMIINLSSLPANGTYNGYVFDKALAPGSFSGTLTSVSNNVTLTASTNYTYADDLTIYVAPLPLTTGGLLQVGGFSNLNAGQRFGWSNGGSSTPGTTSIGTVGITTPITFNSSTNSAQAIWIGNGYGANGTSGTWTGTLTLHGITAGAPPAPPASVPEPSTFGLLGFGAVGLFLRKRFLGRKKTDPCNGVEADPFAN